MVESGRRSSSLPLSGDIYVQATNVNIITSFFSVEKPIAILKEIN
jgi:hypothetical protein